MSDDRSRRIGSDRSRRRYLLSTAAALSAGAGCLRLEEEGAQREQGDGAESAETASLEREWTAEVGGHAIDVDPDSSRAFVASTGDADLTAISLRDGSASWEYTVADTGDAETTLDTDPEISGLTRRGGTLYGAYRRYMSDDRTPSGIVAVDPETGSGETARLVERTTPAAAPVAIDGTVVVGFSDHNANEFRLIGLDGQSLDRRWERDGETVGYGGGVVHDGIAYVSFDSTLARLDPADGSLEPLREAGIEVGTGIDARGNALYYCPGGGRIALYDLERETVRRATEIGFNGSSGWQNAGPVVGPDRCYAGLGSALVAVDRRDGREAWTRENLWVDADDDPVGQRVVEPAVGDGLVWSSSEGGTLVGLDPETGETVVSEALEERIVSVETADGTVLAATERAIAAFSVR